MSNNSTVVNDGARVSFRISPQLRNGRHWATIVILALSDIISFGLALVLFRLGHSVPEVVFFPQPSGAHQPIDVFYMSGCLFIVIRYLLGDYSHRRLFWENTRSAVTTLMILSVPSLLIVIALRQQYSLFAEIGSWSFLMCAIPPLRQGSRVLMDYMGIWRLPTALLTSETRLRDVYTTISGTLTLGYKIHWVVLDGPQAKASVLDERIRYIDLKEPLALANELSARGCDQVVIATDDMPSNSFADLVQRLMEADIGISFVPTFRRLPLGGISASYFMGKDMLLFQFRSSLRSFPSRFIKRTFDFFISLTALTFLTPVFGVIGILIKLHDGGPIFYSQYRVGRKGQLFRCFKFRSMAPDADERLRRWSIENPALHQEFLKTYKLTEDPRITRIGAWLRKTSLDELPQLWNVFIGEMSLVGPRPVVLRELTEHYGPAARLYERVRPGLTGLWQVRGRSDTSYEERVVFDEWYILNWSFWYDIVILLQTVQVVLLRKGAY